jgi:hypothetical protein
MFDLDVKERKKLNMKENNARFSESQRRVSQQPL